MTIRILLSDAVQIPSLRDTLLLLNNGIRGRFQSWVKYPDWYEPIQVLLDEERDAVAMIKPCPELLFGVFVAPTSRRRGKATRLWKEAVAEFGDQLWTQPHDEASTEFFRSLKVAP